MSNYSTLQSNILMSLSDVGKVAFLWACERTDNDPYLYKAEDFAHRVESLNDTISEILLMSMKTGNYDINIEKMHHLKNFILDRQINMEFPNEKRTWTKRNDIFNVLLSAGLIENEVG